MPKEVTRHIPHPVQLMLWGKAAGRCEFAGCNKVLWKSPVTQEQVNIAQKAHIYSFGDGGPRGNAALADEEINAIANLMLVCYGCHQKIDDKPDGGRYTADLLKQMKLSHERRIELVTAISPQKQSHVLLYGANIGNHSSPLSFPSTASAIFPDRYPADDKAIELGMINSSFRDRDKEFWAVEGQNLRTTFSQRVHERMACGGISHLSVFGLAPQPLLIMLGTLLTDIAPTDVFQLQREPQGWRWPEQSPGLQLRVEEPREHGGKPALVLSLSATITEDRIQSVLGQDASIWKVTIPVPHNDCLKSREQLACFRSTMRPLLDKIKACHGQTTRLHIFPAAPVAIAIETGRVRMPKADMPWVIYDQVNQLGGFVEAISIPEGGT